MKTSTTSLPGLNRRVLLDEPAGLINRGSVNRDPAQGFIWLTGDRTAGERVSFLSHADKESKVTLLKGVELLV